MQSITVEQFIDKLTFSIFNPLLALFFAVAFLVFVWGIFEMVRGADDETARAKGRQHVLWGVIGMFIMISAVAIVNLIKATVGS